MSEISPIKNDYKKILDDEKKIEKINNYGFVAAVATVGSYITAVMVPETSLLSDVVTISAFGSFTAFTALKIAEISLKIKEPKKLSSFVVKHGEKEDLNGINELNKTHNSLWKKASINVGAAVSTTIAILYTAPLIFNSSFTLGAGLSIGATCGFIAGIKNMKTNKDLEVARMSRNSLIDKIVTEKSLGVASGEIKKMQDVFNKTDALLNTNAPKRNKGPK